MPLPKDFKVKTTCKTILFIHKEKEAREIGYKLLVGQEMNLV